MTQNLTYYRKEVIDMKEWKDPEMWKLNAQSTEAGGRGLPIDGVVYQIGDNQLVGTSGPPLPFPVAH